MLLSLIRSPPPFVIGYSRVPVMNQIIIITIEPINPMENQDPLHL
jgi:hypothetical protein